MLNIQPGSTRKLKKSALQGTGNSGTQLVGWFTTLVNAALFVGLVAALFHTYISLQQQISVTEKESAAVKKEMESVERELAQQRSLYATRSSESYLMAQVRRFNLPLVNPQKGQLRKMSLLTPEQASRVISPRLRMRKIAAQPPKTGNRRLIAGN